MRPPLNLFLNLTAHIALPVSFSAGGKPDFGDHSTVAEVEVYEEQERFLEDTAGGEKFVTKDVLYLEQEVTEDYYVWMPDVYNPSDPKIDNKARKIERVIKLREPRSRKVSHYKAVV